MTSFTAKEDYLPLTGAKLLFKYGRVRACITVPIVIDEITENAESFTAVISAVPPAVTIGDPDTTVITIGPETRDNVTIKILNKLKSYFRTYCMHDL